MIRWSEATSAFDVRCSTLDVRCSLPAMIHRVREAVQSGPGEMVAAAEEFIDCLGNVVHDFACQIAHRRFFFSEPVSGQTMQIHTGSGGGADFHALGDQTGNQTGEHIPHAAGGHAWIAGGIDEKRSRPAGRPPWLLL